MNAMEKPWYIVIMFWDGSHGPYVVRSFLSYVDRGAAEYAAESMTPHPGDRGEMYIVQSNHDMTRRNENHTPDLTY